MKIDNHNRKLAPASISKTTIISNRIVVSGEAMCGPIYDGGYPQKDTHHRPRDIDIQNESHSHTTNTLPLPRIHLPHPHLTPSLALNTRHAATPASHDGDTHLLFMC
jgi:hypothetical protein